MKVFLMFMLLALMPRCAEEPKDSTAELVRDALQPLPEVLRADATVVLEVASGKRAVLRKGTGNVICRADTPARGFDVFCYQKDMDAFWTRFAQLAREGKSNEEIRNALSAEASAGEMKIFAGATVYELSGDSVESSLPSMAIFLPNATAASTGLSTERSHYRPWLMWAGTPFAHVMIPGK
jgi:hypothetical protein